MGIVRELKLQSIALIPTVGIWSQLKAICDGPFTVPKNRGYKENPDTHEQKRANA